MFKFYYSSSSFIMLCIYVITSCLVFPLFTCSIKFLRGSHFMMLFPSVCRELKFYGSGQCIIPKLLGYDISCLHVDRPTQL